MPIKAPETTKIAAHVKRVECRGGDAALGHPRVFYTFGKSNLVTCEYCDREFIRNKA